MPHHRRVISNLLSWLTVICSSGLFPVAAKAEFRAGAAVIDVTPRVLPAVIEGYFFPQTTSVVISPLNARAIVLDDGKERLAIVVVDSCELPRLLLDEAKQLAAKRTKISTQRMLISATHTHSGVAAMGSLGVDPDPHYRPYIVARLAEAIAAAEANLEPARVGWGIANAAEFTALRRWIVRPDRVFEDPFGNRTVRANMHVAKNWDDVIGESGPEDPDLSLISIQSQSGRPLAVLANFSMHYFGDKPISADYFGLFSEGLKSRIAGSQRDEKPAFVGVLSHGCSGDIWRRDYRQLSPAKDESYTIDTYTAALLDVAMRAYEKIEYREDVTLAMSEARLKLKYRVPDKQLLEWAQRIVDGMAGQPPKTYTEVYAREQLFLDKMQSTEIIVQALRLGEIGISTTPTETYALTGLKIKHQSPLPRTMVIELANGAEGGYIPPPEQHRLGGYNTWASRSEGLEVQAEPKIAETAIQLLEKVAGKPRREHRQTIGPAAEAVLQAKPAAYWRLDEFSGPEAIDSSGNQRNSVYEDGVVFFLEGPRSDAYCGGAEVNRSAHFVGGRLRAKLDGLRTDYTVSMWLWNGMPANGRDVTGWLFSRGREHILDGNGDHLGLGGTAAAAGKLIFARYDGNEMKTSAGKTEIPRWSWNHMVFARKGDAVQVYLNGKIEIDAQAPANFPTPYDRLFFGGRCDNESNWEGRLDEISIFDRALTADEIQNLFSK